MTSLAAPIIERTATDVDGPQALRRIAEACLPVVIRGLCRDWPAVRAGAEGKDAAIAYMAGFDTPLMAEYFAAAPHVCGRYHYGNGPGGFNFSRETINVRDALSLIHIPSPRD